MEHIAQSNIIQGDITHDSTNIRVYLYRIPYCEICDSFQTGSLVGIVVPYMEYPIVPCCKTCDTAKNKMMPLFSLGSTLIISLNHSSESHTLGVEC